MTKSIYFTRHGRVHNRDAVGTEGYEELHTIRMLLATHAFRPKVLISSPANRCIETARCLAIDSGAWLFTLERLHVSGDVDQLRPHAASILEAVAKVMGEEEEAVVSCHDSMSVVLAWTLLERRGVEVKWWMPHELRFLDQGQGILVKGDSYWHLRGKPIERRLKKK